MEELDARDRALATRLVLGVTGASGLLDERIDARLARRAKLEPKVRDAMRLATFELLFLQTPEAVAVSEGVELVRRARPRAAGLANAVLRKVAAEDVRARHAALRRVCPQEPDLGRAAMGEANGDVGGDDLAGTPAGPDDLALVSGYPAWLLERMGDAALQVARSATEPAPVYVASNRARHDDASTLALLDAAGLDPAPVDVAGSFVLRAPQGLAASGLVERCDVVVADLSAQRVVSRLGCVPGMRVLEVGQGRGTKSVLMESAALRAGGLAHIVGVDSVGFKSRVATRRMARAGLADAVRCVTFDARGLGADKLPRTLRGPFDLVFVDAPCSGTGTLRRHPEIAWGLTPADLEALAALQLQILEASAARVRPGGALCYATCSVLAEENDGVVEAFLASEAGACFALDSEPPRTHPEPAGPDGHFLARLVSRPS